jgi:DNA-binding transcriptional regulator YbjK
MSLPVITENPFLELTSMEDTDKLYALIMATIALEEAAISHVINAEAEKIQKFVQEISDGSTSLQNVTVTDVLNANRSVGSVLESAGRAEDALSRKLDALVNALEDRGLMAMFDGTTATGFYIPEP